MTTFAFIVTTWTALHGVPASSEAAILDHDLSFQDCARLLSAYEPTHQTLPGGFLVAHTPSCEAER